MCIGNWINKYQRQIFLTCTHTSLYVPVPIFKDRFGCHVIFSVVPATSLNSVELHCHWSSAPGARNAPFPSYSGTPACSLIPTSLYSIDEDDYNISFINSMKSKWDNAREMISTTWNIQESKHLLNKRVNEQKEKEEH